MWDWRRSSTTDNVLSLRDHVRVLPAFPLSVDKEPNQDANEHAARHQDSPTLAGSTDLGTQKLRTQAEQHVRISIFPKTTLLPCEVLAAVKDGCRMLQHCPNCQVSRAVASAHPASRSAPALVHACAARGRNNSSEHR